MQVSQVCLTSQILQQLHAAAAEDSPHRPQPSLSPQGKNVLMVQHTCSKRQGGDGCIRLLCFIDAAEVFAWKQLGYI